jgi:hypothetical protein
MPFLYRFPLLCAYLRPSVLRMSTTLYNLWAPDAPDRLHPQLV